MKRLDRIHDNAERTADLPPGEMLLARLVLNGHLYVRPAGLPPNKSSRSNREKKLRTCIV